MFECVRCGGALTVPLSQVVLPLYARHSYGNGPALPVLMEPGTYAVDPEPFGPPWRPWSEVGPEEAEARGVYAPVSRLSYGPAGAVVIAPGDARGTVLIPGRNGGFCCGLTGMDGPNMACEQCDQEVATRVDDCALWQAVWFEQHAVRRRPAGGAASPVADWETLAEERRSLPPVEPGKWGDSWGDSWDIRWECAAGAALAHLLVASGGGPVSLPGGLLTTMFGRALDMLLPPSPRDAPVKEAALAGPGLPAPGPAVGIAVVPRHPQTGAAWQPPGRALPLVPLPAEVWMHLAFRNERRLVPATGRLPEGVLRDEQPLPPQPTGLFCPDGNVFRHTLARLPAVREPWLRAIHDRVQERPYGPPF
ncbi:hypothetical protein [Streptomyces mashuensis]|uniref:hypothetical protein n=1 Tax=Streptomyces mashuensis TaxID=33904 RepID=UPI0027E4F411|nr:hypothetical protein [Streptomyces mashuensis]